MRTNRRAAGRTSAAFPIEPLNATRRLVLRLPGMVFKEAFVNIPLAAGRE
jgi:hypothetical protein